MDEYQFFNEPDQGAVQEFGGASIEDYVRLARLANDVLGFIYTHYTKCKFKSVQSHSGIMPMIRNVQSN